MARRFVDISVPLESGIRSDPPGFEPEIEYETHAETADNLCAFFPGLEARPAAGPRGLGDRVDQAVDP